ncbi:MAG: amidase [Lacisediminihabitans sp.]
MPDELCSLTITEAAGLVERREVSPVDLTRSAFDRIERYDAQLAAFISRYQETAMLSAKEAEREISHGNYRGRLHGIPIALKDNIYLRGEVTTMGSKIHQNFTPDYDAGVVERLRAGGAVILGKTNMHEYALGVTTDNPHYGTCRNPWDLSRSPGGSSGGSAVAVASQLAYGALGTDTSGSIRIPAAACGLVGLKPTYGRIGKHGIFPEAWTLDHVGTLTRCVADAAIMLDAISGHDQRDPTSLDLAPTRLGESLSPDIRGMIIGIEEDYFFADVDSDVARIVRSAIDTLQQLGAVIRPITLSTLRHCVWALSIIDSSETTTVHEATLRERPEDYGNDVRFLLECGTLPSAVDYLQAQQLRAKIKHEFAAVFTEVDVIAAPTVPIRTPMIGELVTTANGTEVDTIESLMRLVGPANLVGLPSVSLPCGLLDGMPVGIELMARPLNEQQLLIVAATLESTDTLRGHAPTAYSQT